MSDDNPFFRLHTGLLREGPGDRETLDWALSQVSIPKDGAICDAGCGAGADTEALLDYVPEGTLDAVDSHAPFLLDIQKRLGDDPRVTLFHDNYALIKGPYDLIWSAGAVYFIGVTVALQQWRAALKPGGAVAFSQVYWKTNKPSNDSKDLWEDYGHMPYEAEVYDQVRQAGFKVIAGRELSEAAWEEYYTPLEARIAELRPDADGDLRQVLEQEQREINVWRENKDDYGYLMVVCVPE